jgi:O-antigen/teichoic acid export membrane protein
VSGGGRRVASSGRSGGPGGGRLARLAGNAGWNLADQVLSTVSNAALTVLVAQIVDEAVFGAFMTAFLVFSLFIAVERALVGQVLSIRHSAETRIGMRGVAARALGTTVTLSVPAGLLVIVVGLLLGGTLRGPLVAVGVVLPLLLLQDTCRMIFFAQSRAKRAAGNDTLWAVVQFAATAVLLVAGLATATSMIVVWGAAAGVATVFAAVQLQAAPRLSATGGWVREHRGLLGYLLPEALTTTGGDKASIFAVGGIVGAAGLGAVSGARQVLNPLQVVTGAAVNFAMPEIARREHLSPRVRRLVGLGLGGGIAALSVAYTGAILLLPDAVGHFVLKDSWTGIRSTLLPMGVFTACAGACAGPFIVIAAMGHAKRTFRLTVLATVLLVIGMPLGAVLGGAPGAAWGMCLAKAIEIPFWIATLFRVVGEGPVRRQVAPREVAGGPESAAVAA